jgi:hypothetical protein
MNKSLLTKIFLIYLPLFLMAIHLIIAFINSFIYTFPKETIDIFAITGVLSGIYGLCSDGYLILHWKKCETKNKNPYKHPLVSWKNNPYFTKETNSNYFNFYKNSPRIK